MNDDEKLENEWDAQLDKLLKSLPEKKAPESLISNVFDRIEARKVEAWYRKSYDHWPLGAKILGFILFALVGALFYSILNGARSWGMPNEIVGTQSTTGLLGMAQYLKAFWQSNYFTYLASIMAIGFALYGALFGVGVYAWKNAQQSSVKIS